MQGKSYGQLKKKYNLPRSTIQFIVKSNGKCKKKNGRKEIINKQDKRRIVSLISEASLTKTKCSSKDIINNLNIKVSRSTVCRVIKCLGFNYKTVQSKFKINFKQRQKRVEAAKRFIIDGIRWDSVIFTDEKYFTLNGCDSYYCWLKGNKSFYGIKKVIRAPGLMIWGMVLCNGLFSFEIMRGKQNTKKYIDIVEHKAVPIIKLNMQGQFIYQQDNCPIHVSKEAQNFFRKENIDCLKWPPYSPDLNIVENIWSYLATIVYQDGHIKNLKDLQIKICNAITVFNETQKTFVQNLYNSIPARLCDVILKRGERLKY